MLPPVCGTILCIMEGLPNHTNIPEKETASKRLSLALEAQMKLTVKEMRLHGEEHINAIPEGKKVIIATTHISDIDIPLVAAALSKYFDIAITNMSIHHSFFAEPSTNIGMRIAGKENFIPIDFNKDEGEKRASFNPDNFEPMAKALDEGKAIIIAAHNPAHGWALTKGGYGASYLSDIAKGDVVILPVSVNLVSEKPVGMHESKIKTLTEKPVADIYINEPIELEKISGIKDLSDIMHKHEKGVRLTPLERQRFSELKATLQSQSDSIMERLAASLPEEKRGGYKVAEDMETM